MGVFQKLGDHTSLASAQLQLKSLCRLMKQEKKGRGSHTPSKQKRLRAHTLSRASNFHHEVDHASTSGRGLPSRPRDLQNKTGTWSTGKKPRPQLDSVPMTRLPAEDFAPDPILAIADMSPSWAGHMRTGCDTTSSSYPLQPATAQSRDWSCDMSYTRPSHYRHANQHSQQETTFETNSVSSFNSRDLSSSQDSAHRHAHPSEVVYDSAGDRGRYGYESVGPRSVSRCSEGEVTTGRSTALPSLSYCSSTSSFLDMRRSGGGKSEEVRSEGCGNSEGRGNSEDELTDEEEDHMRELQKAGLELARAGLELAGYEVEEAGDLEIGEGTDKEWEQWQQINEEAPR